MATAHDPSDDDRQFWRGEIVFDRRRTDILSDPLCVVEPEATPLKEYKHTDNDTYHAVKHNDTNTELAGMPELPDSTRCITVAFLDGSVDQPTVEDRTYTYPTFRLMRVVGIEEGYRPPTVAAAELLRYLEESVRDGGIDSVEELHYAMLDSGIDGEVLAAVSEWDS